MSFPVTPAPQYGGKPPAANLQNANCWILNDDPFGTIHGIAKQCKFDVLRLPDQRLLNRSGASRNVLLEALNVQKPDIVLGFLRLPATAVGTQVERTVNETIGALCTQQMNAQRAVLLLGPLGLRQLYMPGVRDLIRNDILHTDFVSGCCFGITSPDGKLLSKRITSVSSFRCTWPLCKCDAVGKNIQTEPCRPFMRPPFLTF